MLRHFRSNLRCAAVRRFPSAEDKVVFAQIFDQGSQRHTGSQRIGTGHHPVGEQVRFIRAQCDGVFQDVFGLRRSHGNDRDLCTVFIFQNQCGFQRFRIIGI